MQTVNTAKKCRYILEFINSIYYIELLNIASYKLSIFSLFISDHKSYFFYNSQGEII